jgi:predicted TIM-barrel fold metal-dependent hydrolase
MMTDKAPVSAPACPLPVGAWDTHAHVFGPYDRFPLAVDRAYDPPLAPYEDYVEMLDRVDFARGVLVHAAANGFDNSATLDAVARSRGRVLGIAVVSPEVSDGELEHLAANGIRGLRFTEMGATPGAPRAFSLLFHDLKRMAPRLRALGMHAQMWAKCDFIVEQAKLLQKLGLPLVIDHMGSFDVMRGVRDSIFQGFLEILGDGQVWVKLTPIRNSRQLPNCTDVRPFHEALLDRAPDRLLWGSDWPYIRLNPSPDVGKLVDLFDDWTRDSVLRHKIFVTNPQSLFGVE